MLGELSINLLLNIGSVRSLKIEAIYSRSLGLGLDPGPSIHCRTSVNNVL